jgi:DNA primase
MKRDGMDFSQALKFLAERAGVQLTPPSPELDQSRLVNDRLENTLEQAAGFFRNQLIQTSAGKVALEYLYKRGLKDPIIEGFGYGYAPDSWDAMISFFTNRGVDIGTLQDCGLVSERENGGYYDRFRNRIMIPIRSVEGKMAGFGARILDPNDMPKFLNSPQTALFDKGRLLFGLDKARKSIRLLDQAVLVEGYLDVTALHQAGFTNVVSPMGTALSEDHLRQLKKYTRRIILALDADAAGEKATLRGLEVARDAMDHNTDFVFDIHGLLRHENRLQADIRVTTLPEGLDPDEVVNRDPEEWKSIISKASPLVIHVMESLAKSRDINDPKVKNEIAAQMIPLIEDVPNTVERDTYRQRLARLLRVDEDALMGQSKIKPVRRQYTRTTSKQITDNIHHENTRNIIEPSSEMEKHCLALLTRIPELIYRMDRLLQQSELDCLSEKDFSNTEYMEIFLIISKSLTQDELDPSEYILENIPPPQKDALKKLLDSYNPDKINEDDLISDLLRTVIRMRHNKINESLRQLRFLQEEEQEQGQQQANIPFQDLVLTYTQNLLKLNHALVINQQIKQL